MLHPLLRPTTISSLRRLYTSPQPLTRHGEVRRMACRSCGSDQQHQVNGEVAIRFPSVDGVDKPIVWVFPRLSSVWTAAWLTFRSATRICQCFVSTDKSNDVTCVRLAFVMGVCSCHRRGHTFRQSAVLRSTRSSARTAQTEGQPPAEGHVPLTQIPGPGAIGEAHQTRTDKSTGKPTRAGARVAEQGDCWRLTAALEKPQVLAEGQYIPVGPVSKGASQPGSQLRRLADPRLDQTNDGHKDGSAHATTRYARDDRSNTPADAPAVAAPPEVTMLRS
jgi:hypothetical protein